jgi:hypothetical protein
MTHFPSPDNNYNNNDVSKLPCFISLFCAYKPANSNEPVILIVSYESDIYPALPALLNFCSEQLRPEIYYQSGFLSIPSAKPWFP